MDPEVCGLWQLGDTGSSLQCDGQDIQPQEKLLLVPQVELKGAKLQEKTDSQPQYHCPT